MRRCRCGCGAAVPAPNVFLDRAHYRAYLRDPKHARLVREAVQKAARAGVRKRRQRALKQANARFRSKAHAYVIGHREGRQHERAKWRALLAQQQNGAAA